MNHGKEDGLSGVAVLRNQRLNGGNVAFKSSRCLIRHRRRDGFNDFGRRRDDGPDQHRGSHCADRKSHVQPDSRHDRHSPGRTDCRGGYWQSGCPAVHSFDWPSRAGCRLRHQGNASAHHSRASRRSTSKSSHCLQACEHQSSTPDPDGNNSFNHFFGSS